MSDFATAEAEPVAVRGLLDQTLAETMRRLRAHAGAVYLLEPDGRILSVEVGAGYPRRFTRPLHRVSVSGKLAEPLSEAVRDRRLVWIPSAEEYARRYPQAALVFPHLYAMVTAPLVAGDTAWGGMLLFWPPGRSPDLSAVERRTISAAADRMAAALRAAAEAGHRLLPAAEPRALSPVRRGPPDVIEAVAAADYLARLPDGAMSLDLEGRITFVSSTATELLNDSAVRLLGTRPWESLPWLRDPIYEQRYRDAVVSRQPASFSAQCLERYLHFELYADSTGVSVRITPARAEHGPRGSDRQEAAPLIGPTRLGTIYHLMHLAGALGQTVGVDDVVDLVADQVMLAFEAQAFALLVPDSGRFRILGARGFTAESIATLDRTPLTALTTPGVLGLTAGTPSFFASRQELAAAYPVRAQVDDGMSAWAYLPLIISGRPVGTCVLGYDEPRLFSAEERRTLIAFSGLIAQALDRARLYDAKQHLAQGLQDSLLPHELPRVPDLEVAVRYLPSSHGIDVGGDFYDIIRIGPGHVVAVIGDVQGHNVHAAALMGQVRTAIHAYAVAGKKPGRILARTNQLLTDLDADLLTSCLCVRLDIAQHRARLATAGHCPPLLRHPDHRTEVLDLPPGPLLGADPAAVYPMTDIPLAPGAVLAFYTDGLIETPSDPFGSDLARLVAVLSQGGHRLDGIADELISQTEPSGHRTDDTALLLLRIVHPATRKRKALP